ncbi:WD40 repeat domain-containing serine/threonine protein kinase [Nonomuraea typhae]|uniref:WD40 repeat domain-containing serine/threonine protein kinase n=1 Tax=Nonomuraea typhae TaxID=2603600 RepID=A0ABW7Z971_9ACTN
MKPLQPGDPRQIGGYLLEARLGAGGMGQVFLGTSPGGRQVAVKVIRAEHADDARFRQRFAREVEAARRVGGFHTAQLVDADPEAPSPWLVTAFVPGPTLHQAVDEQGPLAPAEVHALAVGLAEGLAAIHACGLVHRDLKPGNVIMAADGPRIIDFGIAHAADLTAMTSHHVVVGSYAYMSPEQVLGEAPGPASDVFSLGCVLAYAAVGRSLFEASSIPAIVHRVLHDEPDLSALPGPVRALVAACVVKDPGTRVTLEKIIAAPERVAAPVLPPRPSRTTGDTVTRGAATMVATRQYPAAAAATAPAVPRRHLIIGGIVAAGAAVVGVAPAVALLRGDVGKRVAAAPPVPPTTRKAPRMAGVMPPSRTITVGDVRLDQIAFSPNGRTLAGAGGDIAIRMWDVDSGSLTDTLTGHDRIVTAIAFSPDERRLASTGRDAVLIWNLVYRTAQPVQISPGVSSLSFSPDSRTLAGAGAIGYLWDVETGRRRATYDVDSGDVGAVAYSPDCETIAAVILGRRSGSPGLAVHLLDASNLRRTGVLTGTRGVLSVAFSPDGRKLAGCGIDETVRIWDRATHRTTAVIRATGARPNRVVFAPDGKTVAASCGDKTIRLWDARTGKPTATLVGLSAGLKPVAFSPDGTTIVSAGMGDKGGTVALWKVR